MMASKSSGSGGRLSRLSKGALAFSAALLAVAFVVPVWRIDLVAPQYPEGLGMLIRINTITGIKPADLNNINGLNHYIGMKAIVPDAIPVLKIMPVALGILVVLGIVVALYGRRWAAWSWLGLVAASGVAALSEFYKWSYDYGHNLAPDAIIKIPGMSYQPPLIGTKQLLNFTASSWPSIGGVAAGVGFVLAATVLLASMRGKRIVPALAAAICIIAPGRLHAATVTVSPNGLSLADAVRDAAPGSTIVVKPGHYLVHMLVIDKPLILKGEQFPVIDGGGKAEVIRVSADNVSISGITVTGTGVSYTQDRAAIRVTGNNCRIERNRIENVLYGIYLAKSNGCRVEGNSLNASGRTESTSGNGIHLWSSRGVTIANNRISRFRDGIYFEFVHDTRVVGNVSELNLRYGLHFMESDDCEYLDNTFRNNGAGVAVMFTKRVVMRGNRFEMNRGSSAYGLLLKEVENSRIESNVFAGNTTGLYADGADRIQAISNKFILNGWAVKVGGSTLDGVFARNDFIDNTFDVTTSTREPSTKFVGNYWSSYAGYDIDHDGVGDVPHRPVRLFAVIIEQNPQAVILMRSMLSQLLDVAERVMPALTPEMFVDPRPSMRKVA